ncbi:hypothetical protein P691DRAFT_784587 [Macrolepiota fuliginosa MF-IS2]|uniref:Uncharacterized protein n=1 Tax=Macrolepiota fuliginosa MF-IS2 TaxID=1400762 RepID=A0A9P6BZ71_9AGAR|nr:hypothetical protein P691DRAFT_784587 [Macrolepiota fuliginosa MF-IS2]
MVPLGDGFLFAPPGTHRINNSNTNTNTHSQYRAREKRLIPWAVGFISASVPCRHRGKSTLGKLCKEDHSISSGTIGTSESNPNKLNGTPGGRQILAPRPLRLDVGPALRNWESTLTADASGHFPLHSVTHPGMPSALKVDPFELPRVTPAPALAAFQGRMVPINPPAYFPISSSLGSTRGPHRLMQRTLLFHTRDNPVAFVIRYIQSRPKICPNPARVQLLKILSG